MTAPTPDQIARNSEGDTSPPDQSIWTEADEMNRLPPATWFVLAGICVFAIVAILIALYVAFAMFSSAFDRAAFDTLGMICPAPC